MKKINIKEMENIYGGSEGAKCFALGFLSMGYLTIAPLAPLTSAGFFLSAGNSLVHCWET